MELVPDIDGTGSTYGAWEQGNAIIQRMDDNDADQYQYWFHMPVSYDTIHVRLSGYFLSEECENCDPETYNLTLDSSASEKGNVVTGKFYHLQAEHTYYFRTKGKVNNYISSAGPELE